MSRSISSDTVNASMSTSNSKYFKEELEYIKEKTLQFAELKKRKRLEILKEELERSRKSDSNRRHSDLQSDVTTRLNYCE